MKEYILLILLTILLTSCAPKVDVDIAKPVEETPIEEPEEITADEAEEISLEENTIEIKEDSFYPQQKTIEKNTEIKWIKKDTRDYNLNCYLEGTRVIQSPDLKEGDSFTYTFHEEGKYTCITTPYGLRNIITVKAQPLLSPTGRAVLKEGKGINGISLAAMIIITIALILAFNYGRKKK